jgi:hypothetical protein
LLPVDLEKCGGGRVMKYGCPPAAVIGRYFRTTEAQFLLPDWTFIIAIYGLV